MFRFSAGPDRHVGFATTAAVRERPLHPVATIGRAMSEHAGWRPRDGRMLPAHRLDDPSFTGAIFQRTTWAEVGAGYGLIWS